MSPRRRFIPTLLLLGFAFTGAAIVGCSSDSSTDPMDPDPTYADVVADGWASFVAGDYADAARHFTDAVALDDAQAEAYSGLGWTSLQLEDPIPAAQSFSEGSTRTGNSRALADLYAGWAFATNALKDPTGATTDAYTDSNARAAEALARDAAWSFTHGLGLDRGDLIVLRAENFFALGEFASSLAEVQILDDDFTVDTGTPEGQADLAERIELLKNEEEE